MLLISKPTKFASDGFAIRGQCNIDAPGWQLRWFYKGDITVLWEGDFSTCRYLQDQCKHLTTLMEVKSLVLECLTSNMQKIVSTLKTDAYSSVSSQDYPTENDFDQIKSWKKLKKKKRF